jgi:hypothetical protein
MTKICSKCKLDKPIDDFPTIGEYIRTYCKECQQKVFKKWHEENKAQRASYSRIYNQNYWRQTQDILRPKRKRYYEKHYKHRHNARRRERIKTEPEYRLKNVLRSRIGQFVVGKNKSAKTMELLGCSLDELRVYLESRFKSGMTWETYGRKGWHIDHIQPCTSFDLLDPKQQRQCFHYSNLQPLWWNENISKGNKISG